MHQHDRRQHCLQQAGDGQAASRSRESERRRFLIHRDDDLSIGPTARTTLSGGLANGAQASRPAIGGRRERLAFNSLDIKLFDVGLLALRDNPIEQFVVESDQGRQMGLARLDQVLEVGEFRE
jgi:hypothetical protein